MRIFTKAGELAFSTLTFPDGQPHFRLETYLREFDAVTIEARICNPSDLFMVLMAADVLRSVGYSSIHLCVRYLLAARMDRSIGVGQPFTLSVVARLINSAGFATVKILDAHSDVALRYIRHAENVLPLNQVRQVADTLGGDFYACAPDHGAIDRVTKLLLGVDVYGIKVRDVASGRIIEYKISEVGVKVKNANILIVDDICDGGATFIKLTEALKKLGANEVNLFVTHGIFSRGTKPLLDAGISRIFTTNSFRDDQSGLSGVVTIPFSF